MNIHTQLKFPSQLDNLNEDTVLSYYVSRRATLQLTTAEMMTDYTCKFANC